MRTAEEPDSAIVVGRPIGRVAANPASQIIWLQVLAYAAVYLIWGSTYLAIRVAVRTLPPFLLAGCRFLLAGSILHAVLRARGVAAPTLKEWARAAVAGFLMITLGNGLVTWAETHVASNLAALLIAAVPLYVAMLDWLRPGGTAPERRTWIGIGLGVLGMVLLVSRTTAPGTATSPAAVVALFVSGLAWAAGVLYARYGSLHRNSFMAAAQQMICGGVAQLIVATVRGEAHPVQPSVEGLVAFAYLTLVGSLITFSVYGWLVKVSTPARLSTTAFVNPVVAVVLGWAILDETLSARALAGAALIIGAVLAMTVKIPRRWR